MKAIKEIKLGKVRFCYEASYETVYTRICQVLKEQGQRLFAPIKISSSKITWYQPERDLRKFCSFMEATDEEKEAIAFIFENKCQIFGNVLETAKLDKVLIIPSLDFLFFTEIEGHVNDVPLNRYDIVISGWACKVADIETEGSNSVTHWAERFKKTHQYVVARFLDGQGKLLTNQSFDYIYLNRPIERSVKSNVEGKVDMGMVKIGGILNFIDNKTNESRSIKIISGQIDYDVMFSPLFSYIIHVHDLKGEPLPGVDVIAKYGNHTGKFLTDVAGNVTSSTQLALTDGGEKLTLFLEEYGTYEYDVKAPITDCDVAVNICKEDKDEKDEDRGEEKIVPTFSYKVHVINQGGEPLAGLSIMANYGCEEEKLVTDDNGYAVSFNQWKLHNEKEMLHFLLYKYGSFEFAVVFPNTNCEIVVEKEDIPPEQEVQSIVVYIVDAENMPQRNHPVIIDDERLVANEDGCIFLGKKMVGSTFVVTSETVPQATETFTVEENRESYTLKLPAVDVTQKVHLKIVNQDNEPIPDYKLNISINDGGQILYDTGEDGIISLGELVVGDVFHVMNTDVSADFYVEQDIPEYILHVNVPKMVVIRLLDEKGEIIQDASITLRNHDNEESLKVTDENGEIQMPYTFFTHKKKVKVQTLLKEESHTKVDNCSLKFSKDCLYYEIRLKKKFPKGCLYTVLLSLLLLSLLLIRCSKDVIVQTVSEDGTPISMTSVYYDHTERMLCKESRLFYKKVEHEVGITDSLGYYTFVDQRYSIASWIFYNLVHESVSAVKGFVKGDNDFVFHWLFNESMPVKIVMKGFMTVKVKNAATQKEISGVSIKGVCTENGVAKEISLTTDDGGKAYLNVSDPRGEFTDIFVLKEGYSGTRVYQKSYERVSNQELLVYLNPPTPCSDQGLENGSGDKGDHCVTDYDMRQEGGRFIFKYYTDTAPDEIIVYDCPSTDIKPEKQIFHYSGSTNTVVPSDFKELNFSSRQISVVVNGKTNWGYIVCCPI